ncbi:MAG: hypothetical protein DRJ50_13915 [Actinobacteria bacterium]|nr:MAG: hypothetical protein DRJ50_13915 [Actinomycetota bacterium]
MNSYSVSYLHLLWLLIAATNFAVQLLNFYNEESRRLYLAKKITTPMLLFGGLVVVVLSAGEFPKIAGTILLAMGLGELGIEGSQVVEFRNGEDRVRKGTPWTVTAAGVLFLLVNLFIGVILLMRVESPPILLLGTLSGFATVAILALLVIRLCRPTSETRTQLLAYSGGLAVLAAGAFSSLATGLEPLGRAALVLMVSDSLVLVRMGANWDKRNLSGFRIQLAFLVVILLLYYLYIWLLIQG